MTLSQLATDLIAVHIRQHEIEDHQVRRVLDRRDQTRLPRRERVHLKPGGFQLPRQQPTERLFILDHQNPFSLRLRHARLLLLGLRLGAQSLLDAREQRSEEHTSELQSQR